VKKVRVPDVVLPPDLARYRDKRPPAKGVDRSEMELRIVSALQRAGASDEEIFAYFDHYELPRYAEEGRSRNWLQSLIKASNNTRKSKKTSTQPLRVIENEHNPIKQSYADGVLVHRVLRARAANEAEGHRPILTKWRQEIIEVSKDGVTKPVSLMTARRMSEALIEQGYVRLEPLNKKSKLVLLTDKGWEASELVRGKWSRYIHLWASPTTLRTAVTGKEPPGHEQASQPLEPERLSVRKRRRPVSAEKKRIGHISSLRKDNQINGCYRLRFKGNKIRYIQLITPPDEWAVGRLWLQLQVEFDQNGLPQHLTLLAEEDPDADPISVLVPSRWEDRKDQVLALAVEIEEADTGYRLAEYVDEQGELRPAVGVIVQSSANFFTPLLAQPHGKILRVQGTGEGKKRRYSFEPVADALPISTDLDFGQLLSDIASTTHRDRIAKLPAGWFHMPPKRKALVQRLRDFAG